MVVTGLLKTGITHPEFERSLSTLRPNSGRLLKNHYPTTSPTRQCMPTFTLYDRPDCPYSKRVRRVLDVLAVDHEEVIVPEAKADRDDLDSITGQRGVPVLVSDDLPEGYLDDSSEISAYLKEHYN